MSYGVEIDELRSSARAAAQAVGELWPVDLARAVEVIRAALPGSASAARAATLVAVWDRRVPAATKQLQDRAEKLSAAAQKYSSNEDAASDDFGNRVGPR